MPSPRPDRALRRLVADLANARGDDIAAVLAKLDAQQRRTIETLLAEYRGAVVSVPVQPTAPAPPRPEADAFDGVSSWLAARVSDRPASAAPLRLGPDAGGPSLEHAMTASALAALRAAAATVRPSPAPPVTPIEHPPRPPRRDRLHDIFLGRRTPS